MEKIALTSPICFPPLPDMLPSEPPTPEHSTQLCRVVRMLLKQLASPNLDQSPLTLQQILLKELLDLEGCTDEGFMLHAITALLSADRVEPPPFAQLRKYPPFPPASEACRRYNWILALAEKKELITTPLTTLYTDSPQVWEQGELCEDTVRELALLYQRIYDRFIRSLKLPVADIDTRHCKMGKKGPRPRGVGPKSMVRQHSPEALRAKIERINALVCERGAAPNLLLRSTIARSKDTHRLDEAARRIAQLCQTTTQLWEALRKFTATDAMLPYAAQEFAQTLQSFLTLEGQERAHAITNFLLVSPLLSPVTEDYSLRCASRETRIWQAFETSIHLVESYEELAPWLPLEINAPSLKTTFERRTQEIEQLSRHYRKAIRRPGKGSSEGIIEVCTDYSLFSDKVWRITGQRMRFVLRSLPELARHIQTLQQKSPQPITMDEELPAWIAALDYSPKPKQKKAKTPPSSAQPLASLDSSWDWIEEEEEVEASVAPISSSTPNELDQLLSTACSLELLPKVGLLLENHLKKSSKVPLEGILLREASHHLFLLHQGMQLLFSGIQRGDRDAVTVAFPLLILDHHTFMESLLKSRMAAASHALSQEHSLRKLGGESPYLQSCNRGDLWERYLHTSRAYHEAHKRELPEALRLMLAIDQGKYNPAELVAFALQTYRELLEEWQPLAQEERLRLITWIESVAPQAPYSMKQGRGKRIEAEDVIGRLPSNHDWQDSPAIPALEVTSHWKRLQAAKRLVERKFPPEQSAYFDRTLQTAHYLFEQCYGARILANFGHSPMGHNLEAMQDELDPEASSNSKVLLYQAGIARRYPEYWEQKPFLRLLRNSRRWVGVEEGFTPATRTKNALHKAITLSSKIQTCCQVAEEQLQLLANDLRLFGVREKKYVFS